MGKAVHRLSNLNEDDRSADCRACGRVSVRRKSNGKVWACLIAQREYAGAGYRRRKDGFSANPEDLSKQRRSAAGVCEICQSEGNNLGKYILAESTPVVDDGGGK